MDQPIDRGEIDRASLDATERLRSRLSGKPLATATRSRPVLPWVLAAVLLTFALGLIANPWFERAVRSRLPFAEDVQRESNAGKIAALDAKLAAIETRAGTAAAAPMPDERLARTEARVDVTGDQIARDAQRIDQLTRDIAALSARVEANNARIAAIADTSKAAADRAQAVLAVQLVRRAIDTGRPIGPLDAALRQSFEARYPAAVQAVSALGASPVTLASLRRDLDAMRVRPAAAGGPNQGKSWFDAFADSVSGVFSSASATPRLAVSPLDAATAALARGDLAGATAQLRRVGDPTRPAVTSWINAAERLRIGTESLATLETATALLPPASAVTPAMPPVTRLPSTAT